MYTKECTGEFDETTPFPPGQILEQMSVAVALFQARNLCLLAANSYYRMLLQTWSSTHAVQGTRGQPLQELVPEAVLPALTSLVWRARESGTSLRLEACAVLSVAGETRYWDWTVDPIRTGEQVGAVLLTVTEVTSHMQARPYAEQQSEAEGSLSPSHSVEPFASDHEWQSRRTVLDQIPEGVVLVEARTGKINYVNVVAADLLGITQQHLVGLPLNQSTQLPSCELPDKQQQSTVRWNFALMHALWGKVISNQEITIVRPDGSEAVVLSSAAPIRASNGLITEAVLVFQDITVRKQHERQRNDFFAIANHELRTPLTTILGYAEILRLRTADSENPAIQSAIARIMQESDHLWQIIDDLLDVSRLDGRLLTLKKSEQDLLALLKQIVSAYAQTINNHRISLSVEEIEASEHADELRGWVDPLRLKQIVTNILSNAVKYSPAGSEIVVGMRPQRDAQGSVEHLLVWIKDQGRGIALRDLPHIFERFYRAETAADPAINGFGIGLYLTRELVQAHGGRIWAESTQGEGSTFFVQLPLKKE